MLWLFSLYRKKRLHNLINLLSKKGSLICPNGSELQFVEKNEKDVKRLYEFALFYGVNFSEKNGSWHYKDGVVELPNGIKFSVNKFDALIFAETFLRDVHFSDFDLESKVVVQAGGFIGDTALYYASRGARVFSFEPDRYMSSSAMKTALGGYPFGPALHSLQGSTMPST